MVSQVTWGSFDPAVLRLGSLACPRKCLTAGTQDCHRLVGQEHGFHRLPEKKLIPWLGEESCYRVVVYDSSITAVFARKVRRLASQFGCQPRYLNAEIAVLADSVDDQAIRKWAVTQS